MLKIFGCDEHFRHGIPKIYLSFIIPQTYLPRVDSGPDWEVGKLVSQFHQSGLEEKFVHAEGPNQLAINVEKGDALMNVAHRLVYFHLKRHANWTKGVERVRSFAGSGED